MKEEFPPIYPSGFHDISINQIQDIFLVPFEDKERREFLIGRLDVFMSKFHQVGISADIWIDGSFSTIKPSPNDMDILFLFNETELDSLPIVNSAKLDALFNIPICKVRYSIDLIVVSSSDQGSIDHYQNLFGTGWNNTKKGIPRIRYEVNR